MTKKRLFLVIPICVIVFPILIYQVFAFQASQRFKESEPSQISAKSLKELVVLLLQSEEAFAGNIKVTYIDPHKDGLWNKAEVHVINTSILDDSIGAVEYIAIAEKKGEIWRLTHYKSHWKCARHVIPNFWETIACI